MMTRRAEVRPIHLTRPLVAVPVDLRGVHTPAVTADYAMAISDRGAALAKYAPVPVIGLTDWNCRLGEIARAA